MLLDQSTTEIYTLSLHDALPISGKPADSLLLQRVQSQEMPPSKRKLTKVETAILERWIAAGAPIMRDEPKEDRKSTRLNSSHRCISYAVFCLKKKKDNN